MFGKFGITRGASTCLVGVMMLAALVPQVAQAGAERSAAGPDLASGPGCAVRIKTGQPPFGNLQRAIREASEGSTLRIRGTCTGSFRIAKNLTLVGMGPAVLRGRDGPTLRIESGIVTVVGLRITGGTGQPCTRHPRFMCGGGIHNAGDLRLIASRVTGNTLLNERRDAWGGGIFSTGPLTLIHSVVADNVARTTGGDLGVGGEGFGGGILAYDLVLINSRVANNRVEGQEGASGGGIWAYSATITDSTIAENVARSSNGTAAGGGMAVGTALVARSTISGNRALGPRDTAEGGGIDSFNLTLRDSTVSGNQAGPGDAGYAGGVFASGGTIVSSTITRNRADYAGGGILIDGTVSLRSTIVAGNQAHVVGGADCFAGPWGKVSKGRVRSGGHNLIGSGDDCAGVVDGVRADLVGTPGQPIAARLAPLRANGGATRTHALLPGSPAIDRAGDGPCDTQTDQRGVRRPLGAACDIGAFEKRR
jgi:hypothetical protein